MKTKKISKAKLLKENKVLKKHTAFLTQLNGLLKSDIVNACIGARDVLNLESHKLGQQSRRALDTTIAILEGKFHGIAYSDAMARLVGIRALSKCESKTRIKFELRDEVLECMGEEGHDGPHYHLNLMWK